MYLTIDPDTSPEPFLLIDFPDFLFFRSCPDHTTGMDPPGNPARKKQADYYKIFAPPHAGI